MTSSTSSTGFRPAGNIFGLDLSQLFDDEETEQGLEGFQPAFTIEQSFQGRSPSTLGYKGPMVPPTKTIFSLEPKETSSSTTDTSGGGSGGGTQQQAPTSVSVAQPAMMMAPPPPPDRTLRSFIGQGGGGADPLGPYVGAQAIGGALTYGYTPEEIQAKARAENLQFGPNAAVTLGLGDTTSYVGALGTEGFLGEEAVKGMQAAGLSDAAIKDLAKRQGQQFGTKAAKRLNYTPDVSSPHGYSGYQTYSGSDAGSYANPVYASASPGSVGAAAIDRMAAAQGISQQQAAQQAVAQGYSLGDAAKAYL